MNSTQAHVNIVSSSERSNHPLRRWFQRGYFCVALFFVLCVLFQVFMAGAGILVTGYWLAFHAAFGNFIILIPVLLLPLGLLGRLPRSVNWLSALLVVLAQVQPLLLWQRHLGLPLIAALHPVNALLIFALPLFLSYHVWGFMRDKQKQSSR